MASAAPSEPEVVHGRALTARVSAQSQGSCHTALPGEHCHSAVVWAMEDGIFSSPDWYPGLTGSSSFEDFQAHMHQEGHHSCDAPCLLEDSATTEADATTETDATTEPEATATEEETTSTEPATSSSSDDSGTATGTHSVFVASATFSYTGVSMTIVLDSASQTASITLQGPSSAWFAVGFNAQRMADTPYTIVVDGEAGEVHERRLSNHGAGTHLPASVEMVSSSLVGGLRRVEIRRPWVGPTPDYYQFVGSSMTVPLISAVGMYTSFSYHADWDTGAVSLTSM
jgi:hypothetical protein